MIVVLLLSLKRTWITYLNAAIDVCMFYEWKFMLNEKPKKLYFPKFDNEKLYYIQIVRVITV